MKIIALLPLDEHPDARGAFTRYHVILPHLNANLMVQEADSNLDEHDVVDSHGQDRARPVLRGRSVQSDGGHQAPQVSNRRRQEGLEGRVGGKGSVAGKSTVPDELMQELVESVQWRVGSGKLVPL